MPSVYRVYETNGTLTGTHQEFQNALTVNLQGHNAIANKIESTNIISDGLGGVPGNAISLLFGAAGWTVSSAATAIAGIVSGSSNSELNSQETIIRQGNLALNHIVDQFIGNSSFSQFEARVTFLVFEMSDTSQVRFVVYNNYTPVRALTPSGWIDL